MRVISHEHSGSCFRAWLLPGLIAVLGMAGCGSQDKILGVDGNALPLPPDATAPTVTFVTPQDNATDVAFNDTMISAHFSEPVVALNDADFTVTCEAPCSSANGQVSMNTASTIATFTVTEPDSLDPQTQYTATLSSATSSDTGLTLQAPLIWRFTTAATVTAPTVTAVAPENNAVSVAFNDTVISAHFSEPVEALSAADFTVTCEAPCNNATGTVTMNANATIATFRATYPSSLDPQTQYTVTISSATSSDTGLSLLAPFVWRFTTGLTPDTTKPRVTLSSPPTSDPGPTTGVPTNTAISAVFSEDMNPLTITDDNFSLSCEFPCEAPSGSVSYVVGSRTLVFTPDDEPDAGSTYTATISSAVTDLAGNQLAGNQGSATEPSDYIWRFTTEVALAAGNIEVDFTSPADGGNLHVCPAATITAALDVSSGLRLDPQTVNNLTVTLVEADTPTNVVVAQSVALDVETGQMITFTPEVELTAGVVYRATLKGGPDGVKDLAVPGNELESDVIWTFTAVAPVESCLDPVALNAAGPFGIIGGSAGITNDGILTIIHGDISTTADWTTVTGFVSESGCEYTVTGSDEGLVNGRIYTKGSGPQSQGAACEQDGTPETAVIVDAAHAAATDAFNELAGLPDGQDPGNDNLAGLTLGPGVWSTATSFRIEGSNLGDDLTLDGQGNQNAVFVFQIGSTLTVGGPGAAFPRNVILINGAQAKNVFWQVGSAATINAGGGGVMTGTIIAQDGVSISTTGNNAAELIVTLNGRALSLGASVTVTNTIINVPAP